MIDDEVRGIAVFWKNTPGKDGSVKIWQCTCTGTGTQVQAVQVQVSDAVYLITITLDATPPRQKKSDGILKTNLQKLGLGLNLK